MHGRAVSWWLLLVSASFGGLWTLLFYCDLFRPASLGWELGFRHAPVAEVRSVAAGSPAAQAGVRVGDRVVTAGGHPVTTRLDVSVVDANVAFGVPLRLELLRNGASTEASVQIRRESWRYFGTRPGLALLTARGVQLLTLGVALLIAFKRPRDPSALAGAWLLATLAVTSVVLPYRFASAWRGLPLAASAILWIAFTSSRAIGGACFLFFSLFPRRVLPRSWLAAAAAPLVGMLALQAYFGWRIVWAPPGRYAADAMLPAIVLVNAAYLAAGLAVASVGYRRLCDLTERRRLRVVLVAAVVGCVSGAPVFIYYWLSSGADVGAEVMSPPAMMAGTLLSLVFPLSFAYAILRHRLFDISMIVRRGVQYAFAHHALAWLVPALVAALVVDLLTRREATIGESLASHGWVYVVILGLAATAQAKRETWLEALDRRFFRERYDAQQILRGFAADIRQSRSLDDLIPRVVAKIDAALHPESIAVLDRPPADESFHAFAAASTAPVTITRDSKIASLARVLQRPIETPVCGSSSLSRDLPAEERATLHDARIELLVPVVGQPDRRELLIALGPRRSEEPYTQEDLDLLATIADGLALVLDRGRRQAREPHAFFECNTCGGCHDTSAPACACGGAALTPVPIPRRLNGRYRLDRRVGEGGMGTVYAAVDLALERDVAVKLVREDLVGSRAARDRFEHETKTVAGFAHPNIVTVHDFGIIPGGRPFIVMELLRGTSLAQRLSQAGRLPPPTALEILRNVCDAVETAHARGIVHRDLKPANVFLAVDDAGARTKVLDFGVARLVAARSDTRTSTRGILGTPPYMAPEQLRGEEAAPAWDVWALTVIAYEMLNGAHPFLGRGALERALTTSTGPGAGSDLEAFFATALSVDPAVRPHSARELLTALHDALYPKHLSA